MAPFAWLLLFLVFSSDGNFRSQSWAFPLFAANSSSSYQQQGTSNNGGGPTATQSLNTVKVTVQPSSTTGAAESSGQMQQSSSAQQQQTSSTAAIITTTQGGVQSTASSSQTVAGLPTVSIQPTSTPIAGLRCMAGPDPRWRFFWPRTSAGTVALIPCPPQFQGRIRRRCTPLGIWTMPDLSNCRSDNIDGIGTQARDFFRGNDSQPDVEGALFLVNQLLNLTMPDMRMMGASIPPGDLETLNYVVGEAVFVLRQNEGPGGDQGSDIVDTLNNALDPDNSAGWSELQQSQSGSEQLLYNAESYASYLASTINSTGRATRFSRSNLALRARRFSRRNGRFSNSRFPEISDLVNSSDSDILNSINIPAAYLEARANSDAADGDVTVVHMLFSSLQEFLPTADNESNPASVIISSQVITSGDQTTSGNSTIESVLLESPIEITFSINVNVSYNASTQRLSARCVYWNFTTDFDSMSYGEWASDGITTADEMINDSLVHCYSHHLTSFAVLVSVVEIEETVDINDTTNDTMPTETELEKHLLSIVSYVGCSISIVCLLVTVVCLLSMRKGLIQKPLNFIHLNLSIALLLALVLFVGGIESAASIPALCKTVAVLMHYFFLSAFSWMFCEAIMLYLMVVIVFSQIANKWWLYLLIGWGLPVIPVAITFGVRFDQYTANNICWLSTEHGIIWSFVGPIIALICINTFILVIVIIRIGRSLYAKKRRQTVTYKSTAAAADKKTVKNQKTAINIIKSMIVLLPLLGSTWIIGIFAVDENTTVFAWLFVILNSLQGAFIFFFHVFKGPLIWGRFRKWQRRNKREKESSVILNPKRGVSKSILTSTSTIDTKSEISEL